MSYGHKRAALDDVRAKAGEYFASKFETEEKHDVLSAAIQATKEEFPQVTQEELAAETDFTNVRGDAKLSRQRVQQILNS